MRTSVLVAAAWAALFCACAHRCTADCDTRVVDAIRTRLHPRPELEFDGMLDHLDKEYQVIMLPVEEEGQVPICMTGTFIGEKNGSKILEYSSFINGAYSMTFNNGFLELQVEDGNEETMVKSHIVYFTHEVVALYNCPQNDFPAQITVSVSSWFKGKVNDQLMQVQDMFKQVGIKSFNEIPYCKDG